MYPNHMINTYTNITGYFEISVLEIITVHHEFPCRIGTSHPTGRNFYQGRGLPKTLVEIPTPKGIISLSYMDWLTMDYFSPTSSEL